MAIKIQMQVPEIPVEIGELSFAVDASDGALKQLHSTYEKFKDEAENIKTTGDYDVDLQQTKDMLKKAFDSLLGDGAYQKIYDQTPSIMHLSNYFVALCEGLEAEFKKLGIKESQKEKAQKYIKNKKK